MQKKFYKVFNLMSKNRAKQGISCQQCQFNSLCLGGKIGEEAHDELNNLITTLREVKKGEYIFHTQDIQTNLYAIHKGSCKDFILDEEGKECISNFYFPGDIIGLESIPHQKHWFSMVALEPTELCVIPIDGLFALMQKHSELLRRFVYITSYKAQNDYQVSMSTNAQQRIADFILNIVMRLQERQQTLEYPLPMGQVDISNFLGMSHETVNRIIQKFRRQKIIALQKKSIQLLNLDELRKFASPIISFGQH